MNKPAPRTCTTKCYALVASDEPLQVRYVGKTICKLSARLNQHIKQFANPVKMKWIREVIARGERVVIRELSQHIDPFEAAAAEAVWLSFWSKYCDTLNAPRKVSKSVWYRGWGYDMRPIK